MNDAMGLSHFIAIMLRNLFELACLESVAHHDIETICPQFCEFVESATRMW